MVVELTGGNTATLVTEEMEERFERLNVQLKINIAQLNQKSPPSGVEPNLGQLKIETAKRD